MNNALETIRVQIQKNAKSVEDSRWQVLVTKQVDSEDVFYYAVSTTGVYCRPTCGARLPKRDHVSFFDSTALAEQAGYRACKRCKPDQMTASERAGVLVKQICGLIEAEQLDDSALAKRLDVSLSHLRRAFKNMMGVTPKAYSMAHRAQQMQNLLQRAPIASDSTITQTIYEVGYASSSRFYEQASQRLGMTPGQYKQGGLGMVIHYAIGMCSLGKVLVATTDLGICAIWLADAEEPDRQLIQNLQSRFARAQWVVPQADFEVTFKRVIDIIDHPHAEVDLPLDIQGTAFQQKVWQALRQIPMGQTMSYTEVAQHIGQPQAVRAVAQACAANNLAVAIPCHRVVLQNGDLSGYRWGVERKGALLKLESKFEIS